MKIIEAKDGIIKYESPEKVTLSAFIEINNEDKTYIAQVIKICFNGAGYTVFARILFNYNGEFLTYDKTLPDKKAEIRDFDTEKILRCIETPVMTALGKFSNTETIIKINSEFLNNKTLICADNTETLNIAYNITSQTAKAIIVDMDGTLEGEKLIAGKDFKVPLNTAALSFIYNDCISDSTEYGKKLITDIFKNLAEYLRNVSFLPFETLKTVVDNLVSTSHDFRIMLLKNKLEKWHKTGYFATKENEILDLAKLAGNKRTIIDLSKLDAAFLNNYIAGLFSELAEIDNSMPVFIKLSNAINKQALGKIYHSGLRIVYAVSSNFKYLPALNNQYKNFILEANRANKEVFKLYLPFLNSMTDKECLVVGEDTNYIPFVLNIPKLSESEIIPLHETLTEALGEEIPDLEKEDEPSEEIVSDNTDEEESAETPISLFEEDEFHTKIDDTRVEEYEESPEDDLQSEETVEVPVSESDEETYPEFEISDAPEIQEEDIQGEEEILSETAETPSDSEIIETAEPEIVTDETLVELDSSEFSEDIIENIEEAKNSYIEPVQEPDNSEDEQPDYVQEEPEINTEELDVIPLKEENNDDFDIVELDSDEATQDDILIELESDIQVDEDLENTVDKEIVEDVDKVFTTIKDDAISETDLDLIDELNELDSGSAILDDNSDAGDDLLSENEGFEELDIPQDDDNEDITAPLTEISDDAETNESPDFLQTKNSTTPIVPVYDAEIPPEDMVVSDPIEQGDTVFHAKYGTGVVEKMIKYGNKNLYSINFDNVGRRLLDPTLTEIKKS